MKLNDYFEEYSVNIQGFCKDHGIPRQIIYNIFQGMTPTLKWAVLIEKGTKGKVKCKDLLSEKKVKKKTKNDETIKKTDKIYEPC